MVSFFGEVRAGGKSCNCFEVPIARNPYATCLAGVGDHTRDESGDERVHRHCDDDGAVFCLSGLGPLCDRSTADPSEELLAVYLEGLCGKWGGEIWFLWCIEQSCLCVLNW